MDIRSDPVRPGSSHRDLTRRMLMGRFAVGGGLAGVVAAIAPNTAHAQATPGAAPPTPIRPERSTYSLEGDRTRIHYSAASDGGASEFEYSGPEGEVTAFDDAVRMQADVEPFGQLVTVTVDAAPDAYVLTLTLVLPGFNLEEDTPTPFATFAILTRNLTTIGGPDLIEGAVRSYAVVELEGVAELHAS